MGPAAVLGKRTDKSRPMTRRKWWRQRGTLRVRLYLAYLKCVLSALGIQYLCKYTENSKISEAHCFKSNISMMDLCDFQQWHVNEDSTHSLIPNHTLGINVSYSGMVWPSSFRVSFFFLCVLSCLVWVPLPFRPHSISAIPMCTGATCLSRRCNQDGTIISMTRSEKSTYILVYLFCGLLLKDSSLIQELFQEPQSDDRSTMIFINCARRRSCMFVIDQLG